MKHVTLILALILACSFSAAAATIHGAVHNGTTNRPSPNDEVTLKRVGNGMEEVAKTTSNAKGEFVFDAPAVQLPYVIFVKHQNITYTGIAEPGGPSLTIEVFEAAPEVRNISLQQRMMVVQTDGDKLRINELYTVDNSSAPPKTETAQRTFEIYLPEGAAIQEAGARPNGVMPLKVPLVPQAEKNRYAFNYPIRPGETQFTLTYTLPYSGKMQLDPKLTTRLVQMMLVVPDAIQMTLADGSPLTRTKEQQIENVAIYVATDLNPQQKLSFEIQGSGKLARAKSSVSGESAKGESKTSSKNNRADAPAPQPAQRSTQSPQWVFVIVLLLFLAAGLTYVYAAQTSSKQTHPAGSGKSSTGLIDAVKEEMFRLESDRLEGKLSPEEYAQTKAALDRTMLNAVQRSKES